MVDKLEALLRRVSLLEETIINSHVIQYVQNNESVSDQKPHSLISLMQIIDDLIKLYPNPLEHLLERVFQYNIEGIERCKLDSHEYLPKEIIGLEAYFHSLAGNVAKALFEKTGEVEWAVRAYVNNQTSADMTVDSNPKHSAYAYYIAGIAAKALFEKTGEVEWARRWYNGEKSSADMTVDSNPKHSAYAYSFAGMAANKIFNKTKKVSWAVKSFMAYKISADMTIDSNPEHSAHQYKNSGKLAKKLFYLTNKIKWAKRAKFCFEEALGLKPELDSDSLKSAIYRLESDIKHR